MCQNGNQVCNQKDGILGSKRVTSREYEVIVDLFAPWSVVCGNNGALVTF